MDCKVPPNTMSRNQAYAIHASVIEFPRLVKLFANKQCANMNIGLVFSVFILIKGSVSGSTHILTTGSNFGGLNEIWCNLEGVGSVQATSRSREVTTHHYDLLKTLCLVLEAT